MCGVGRSIEYDGYCYGTVNNQSPDACDTIFAEGSNLATINAMSTQGYLRDHMKILAIEYRPKYVIGLIYNGSEADTGAVEDMKWHGGTPVTYSNFLYPPDIMNSSGVYCVEMNWEDSLKWREFECDNEVVQRASLCEIGKKKVICAKLRLKIC